MTMWIIYLLHDVMITFGVFFEERTIVTDREPTELRIAHAFEHFLHELTTTYSVAPFNITENSVNQLLIEILEILGKEEVTRRLDEVLALLK